MKFCKYFIFALFFVVSCSDKQETKATIVEKNGTVFKAEAFRVDSSGWGYIIYKDGKPYIKQHLIPSVNGVFLFENANHAQIVADFVLNRMLTQKGLPSISVEELDSLGVLSEEVLDFQEYKFSTKNGVTYEDYLKNKKNKTQK